MQARRQVGYADFDQLVQKYPDALKSLFGLSNGGSITSGAGFVLAAGALLVERRDPELP